MAQPPLARRLVSTTLRALGLIAILAGGAGVIFVFQPFGRRGWTFGAVFVVLAWLALGLRRPDRPSRGRVDRLTRKVLLGVLAGWAGLIAWSAVSPGGLMPPTKGDLAAIRVLTWNILLGVDGGAPWHRHGWPVRKLALREALRAIGPEILCVQEALDGQVKFLEAELPRHAREGVGRDDGRSAGEHCAIFYDTDRFERLGGDTFWLEEPADRPTDRPGLGPKRICTWVRLRDRTSGRALRVYNTHNYLTEPARLRAARIILARIASGDPSDEVLLAGDFNASSTAPSRALFSSSGLIPTAESAGAPPDTPTYQFYGIRWRSFDEIYASKGWRPATRRVVDVKPANTFPSDHFGVLADLVLDR